MQALQNLGASDWVLSLAVAVLALLFATPSVWVNLWYLIVTPYFSVRANAEDDHPVFTILLLFSGAYLFNAGLAYSLPKLESAINGFWTQIVQARVTSPNEKYIEYARQTAIDQLESQVLPGQFDQILLLVPILIILAWLLGNLVFWLLSKLSGNDTSLGLFYQIIAYPFFVYWLGQGLSLTGWFIEGQPAVKWTLVALGGIIGLWGLILTVFAYYRAMQAPAILFILFVIIGLGVWGGAGYMLNTRVIQPQINSIITEWNNYHPEDVGSIEPLPYLADHSHR